jgi:hypothetical protein
MSDGRDPVRIIMLLFTVVFVAGFIGAIVEAIVHYLSPAGWAIIIGFVGFLVFSVGYLR